MVMINAPAVNLASPLSKHGQGHHGGPAIATADSNFMGLTESSSTDVVHVHHGNPSTPKSQRFGNVFRKIKHMFKQSSRKAESFSSNETASSGVAGSSDQYSPTESDFSKPETHSQSFLEQSIATIRSASFRKPRRVSKVELIDETWEDWLEDYRKGGKNLSEVDRPTSFCGYGHMAPPIHALEASRLRAVNKVSDRNFWRSELRWLTLQLRQVLAEFKMKSACISIVDRSTQENMLEIGFGHPIGVFGRDLSLDAHTILSKDYFALLDASNDWRTRLNPLVHGPPFVKFYLGVCIKIDNMAIGCISVCDPYLKVNLPLRLIESLTNISRKLTERLQAKLHSKSMRRGSSRIQWDENPTAIDVNMIDFDSSCANLSESNLSEPNLNEPAVEEDTATFEGSASEACSVNSSFSSLPQRQDKIYGLSVPVYNAKLQQLSSRSLIQPFQVFESLLKCQTVPQAIKKACKLVKQNLGADLVYIAEVRTKAALSPILEPKVQAPSSSPTSLRSDDPPLIRVHLVAHCKSDIEVDMQGQLKRDAKLLQSAIASKFGVQYSADGIGGNQYRSGLVIPFRREQLLAQSEYSGGFTMAAFNVRSRSISPGDKTFTKKVVSALENILQCDEELNRRNLSRA